ncbi:MAG: cytochrome c [Taibaiella sp.]|jgi:mono/diheme cytochrome c family protein
MNYKNLFLIPFAALTACSNDDTSSNTVAESNSEPIANNKVEVSESQILFEQKCSLCHGKDGTAGIGNAANLQTSKADSVTSLQIIAVGKGSMPPFKSQLSEQQIHKLVSYVFTLRK